MISKIPNKLIICAIENFLCLAYPTQIFSKIIDRSGECVKYGLFSSSLIPATKYGEHPSLDLETIRRLCNIEMRYYNDNLFVRIIIDYINIYDNSDSLEESLSSYHPISMLYAADLFLRDGDRKVVASLIISAAEKGDPSALWSLRQIYSIERFIFDREYALRLLQKTDYVESISTEFTCYPLTLIAYFDETGTTGRLDIERAITALKIFCPDGYRKK